MKIAVISAYHKEPIEVVDRCHQSVLNQTARAENDIDHFLIADGHPKPEITAWNALHITLPVSNADYGDTPRAIGSAIATAREYDAILYLDADNYFASDHVDQMLSYQRQSKALVVTASRHICTVDNVYMGVCAESDGTHFNDTNCYFITRPAFSLTAHWGYKPARQGIIGDRVFWNAVKQSGAALAHNPNPTVYYTSTLAFHYHMFGMTPPDDSKVIVSINGEHRSVLYKDTFKK